MNILIIRFSTVGDVAMTVPVIHSVANQYSQHQFYVLSQIDMAAYFEDMPSNVIFKGVDFKVYKGFFGAIRLYRELKRLDIDRVADLHDVLRTQVLCFFFQRAGKKVCTIDKGGLEKKSLVKGRFIQLRTPFQYYAEVFARLELPVTVLFSPHNQPLPGWIGIAPFADYAGKIYPVEKMRLAIQLLLEQYKPAIGEEQVPLHVFLFGEGAREVALLECWSENSHQVESVAGKLNRQEELKLISQLQVMVSMDSDKMHIASLVGTPVVSVWGATHPYAGFLGWRQRKANIVQRDLPCRPCSFYGRKRCKFGDYRCLNGIPPQDIVNKVLAILSTDYIT